MIDQAKSQDIQQLAKLIHFDSYVHQHLDYRPPLDWVGDYPFNVLRENGRITAALASPPDPPHVAWIHLFAALNQTLISRAWDCLWQATVSQLSEKEEVRWVAAIPLHSWFSKLLSQENFECIHHILMLSCDGLPPPDKPKRSEIYIRAMSLDDLDLVTKVDQLAFSSIWQVSAEYLRIAYNHANLATVAEYEGKVAGFQISTASSTGGHLARLAVNPAVQGMGIGYALLQDLIDQSKRRGAESISVNTQENNYASLALYKKAGFSFTGEKYPVYRLSL